MALTSELLLKQTTILCSAWLASNKEGLKVAFLPLLDCQKMCQCFDHQMQRHSFPSY